MHYAIINIKNETTNNEFILERIYRVLDLFNKNLNDDIFIVLVKKKKMNKNYFSIKYCQINFIFEVIATCNLSGKKSSLLCLRLPL